MKFQAARCVPNRKRCEQSRFDQYVAGCRGDFRIGTTHHTRQSHGAIGIGDDAHVSRQDVFFVVDRLQLFPGFCATNDDPLSVQTIHVEGMQRLTTFHQDIVCDVDDIVDGRNPDSLQSTLQPGWAGANFNSADNACVVL